jgi:CRISPR/Cas system CMR-associated protein Cmr5 small subunit
VEEVVEEEEEDREEAVVEEVVDVGVEEDSDEKEEEEEEAEAVVEDEGVDWLVEEVDRILEEDAMTATAATAIITIRRTTDAVLDMAGFLLLTE